jgi:hypothetical protein
MTTIQVEKIPAAARQFLQSLDVSQGEVVIEEGGQARFVVADAQSLEQRRKAKQQLFDLIGRIRQRNPSLDSDEVMRELEAVE